MVTLPNLQLVNFIVTEVTTTFNFLSSKTNYNKEHKPGSFKYTSTLQILTNAFNVPFHEKRGLFPLYYLVSVHCATCQLYTRRSS